MGTEIDSIPRLAIADLWLALNQFRSTPAVTFEDLRISLCLNRKKKWTGDLYWSTARDNAVELQRLGLIEAGSFPKDKQSFARAKSRALRITDKGSVLLKLFREDRGR